MMIGAIDALTKVLVGLYEEPERPPNAVDYIKIREQPIWIFPDNQIYKNHIRMCIENNINYKVL